MIVSNMNIIGGLKFCKIFSNARDTELSFSEPHNDRDSIPRPNPSILHIINPLKSLDIPQSPQLKAS